MLDENIVVKTDDAAAAPPTKVLIVDDEQAIRRFLRTSLSAHGYEVHEAANGEDAIMQAIKSCNGNYTQAAKELGFGRSTLYRKMEKYGIE